MTPPHSSENLVPQIGMSPETLLQLFNLFFHHYSTILKYQFIMKNIVLPLIFLSSLFFIQTLNAQINIGGQPYSFGHNVTTANVPVRVMPSIDLVTLQLEDELDERGGLPPRFGKPIDAGFSMENTGFWETLANGDRLWRFSISCPDARSINLLYSNFWLPEGATLYLYNQTKTHVIGGFTSKNNNSPREENVPYATGLIFGDHITLEYYEPQGVEQTAVLDIAQVVHGYRKINLTSDERWLNDSGPCQININCPDGDDWQFFKSSVALIMVGGSRVCTGALLNNAMVDFTPYFLTANHCLGGLDAVSNPQAPNWSFMWNYESPGCANPTVEQAFSTTVGAVLVANKSDSDFALFKLLEDPLVDAGLVLTYNGYDAGTPSAGGAGIHHPSGDIKKISLFQQTPVSDHSCAPSNTWSVVFNHGSGVFSSTQMGSSGSPLFDDASRVIGQLWSGFDTGDCSYGPECGSPSTDMSFYGKFGVSYDDSDGMRRRLRDWIAPTCHTDYTVPSNIVNDVPSYFASNRVTSNREISGSFSHVTFNGGNEVVLTDGFRVSGGAVFRARNLDCGGGSFRMREDGSALMDAVKVTPTENGFAVQNGPHKAEEEVVERSSETTNEVMTSGTPQLSSQPNPFNGATTLSFELLQSETISILIFDMNGQLMTTLAEKEQKEAGLHQIEWKANQIPAGQYYGVLQTEQDRKVIKLVVLQ